MATSKDLKEQLEKAEKQLKAAKEKDEVDFATKKINRIKKELEELEAQGGSAGDAASAKPAATDKKKKGAKKPDGTGKQPKPRKSGSKYADLPSCEELQTAFLERRKQREKSQKQYKTKSFITKATTALATAAKQVAASVKISDNKQTAQAQVSKIEKFKTTLMELIEIMEELTKDDASKTEAQAIFKPLDEKLDKILKEIKGGK
jgi:hypothetical protein